MADPEQIIWPLRAVSKDPTNLTKLDGDNNVLTSSTDLDARYVNVAGDTMTGRLVLNPPANIPAPDGHVQIVGEGFMPAVSVQSTGEPNSSVTPQLRFGRSRGTLAAPTNVQLGDNLGQINFFGRGVDGVFRSAGTITGRCDGTPLAGATALRGHIAFLVNTGTGLPATSMTIYGDSATISVPLTVASIAGNIVMPSGTIFVQSGAVTVSRVGTDANINAIGCSVTVSGVSKVSTGVYAETGGGTDASYCFRTGGTGTDPTDYGIFGAASAQNYLKGKTGIGIIQPQHQLEVGGDTVLRGPLEVTGNITSTGLAHSFAPNSIPASAISGLPGGGNPLVIGTEPASTTQGVDAVGVYTLSCAASNGTRRTALRFAPQTGIMEINSGGAKTTLSGDLILGSTASTVASTSSQGTAGQFKWDADFLYIHTGATGWKKVALTAI